MEYTILYLIIRLYTNNKLYNIKLYITVYKFRKNGIHYYIYNYKG